MNRFHALRFKNEWCLISNRFLRTWGVAGGIEFWGRSKRKRETRFVSEEHEEFRIKLNKLPAGYKFLLLKNQEFSYEKKKKPLRHEGKRGSR